MHASANCTTGTIQIILTLKTLIEDLYTSIKFIQ